MFAVDSRLFVEMVAGAAMGDRLLSGEQPTPVRARGDKPKIVVGAAPKSGGVFLSSTLLALNGLPNNRGSAQESSMSRIVGAQFQISVNLR